MCCARRSSGQTGLRGLNDTLSILEGKCGDDPSAIGGAARFAAAAARARERAMN